MGGMRGVVHEQARCVRDNINGSSGHMVRRTGEEPLGDHTGHGDVGTQTGNRHEHGRELVDLTATGMV